MNVRDLIDKLLQVDPEAMVFMHCREEADVVSSVVRNGDALYFAADGIHEDGQQYIYLSGSEERWLGSDAGVVI